MAEIIGIEVFHTTVSDCIDNSDFIKLIISNKRNKKSELRTVTIKPTIIKKGQVLNFVYRYPTKDITKNFSIEEGKLKIEQLLSSEFLQAELLSTENNWHLSINKKNKANLNKSKALERKTFSLDHDKQKKRLIDSKNNAYLKELGIVNADGTVKPSMQDKYKQINRYVELIDGVLKSVKIDSNFHVADMGAGKGYLTFSLFDYLINTKKITPYIYGVEFRKDLVDKCNRIAQKASFKNLKFIEGTIKDVQLPKLDMLIALHACDTATDDAIYRGIKTNAKIIVCAPCCHKQIRKQLNPNNDLNLITQYGILKERQAEILTDTIRSQILEAFGYKTKVFEFISTEHTPKNVMLVGVKSNEIETPKKEVLERINALKELHGVEYHFLEKLLGI